MLCKSALITGANRGIGLEMVKQMAEKGLVQTILAACRNPDGALDLKNIASANSCVKVLKLDVCNENEIKECASLVAKLVGNDGLNLLVNNAAILLRGEEGEKRATFEKTLLTNVMGPFFVTRELLPLIKMAANKSGHSEFGIARAAVINMSSSVGSIAENGSGGNYAYRCSKAALNQITKTFSIELKDEKILAVNMHPGWVQTGMGGPSAMITTEFCITNMLDTFTKMNETHNGGFFRYNGETIQW